MSDVRAGMMGGTPPQSERKFAIFMEMRGVKLQDTLQIGVSRSILSGKNLRTEGNGLEMGNHITIVSFYRSRYVRHEHCRSLSVSRAQLQDREFGEIICKVGKKKLRVF